MGATLVLAASAILLPCRRVNAQEAPAAAAQKPKVPKKAKKTPPPKRAKKLKPISDLQIGSNVGLGFRISTLGLGAEVAVRVAKDANVRGGVNAFFYHRGYDHNGIQYAGDLKWESAEAHFDIFPGGHSFHISPGVILYNNNRVTATAKVPGGNTFRLNGTSYMSDPADPLSGNATLDFRKAAPTLMFGFGNLVPRNGRHFSFNIEAGVAYAGQPRVALNLQGSVCDTGGLNCRSISSDPTVQSNVTGEQTRISHDLSPFKFYPLVSITFGYHF